MLNAKKDEMKSESRDDKAYQVIDKLVRCISKGAEVKEMFSDQDCTIFEIYKADPGIMIGKHGHTLDAIQYLVNLVMHNEKNQTEQQKIYIVDIDGYRKRREISLKKYALEKAEIVKRKGEPIGLYFMNSIERRFVHLSLKEDAKVNTHSEGKEPYRRVIITPASTTQTVQQDFKDE